MFSFYNTGKSQDKALDLINGVAVASQTVADTVGGIGRSRRRKGSKEGKSRRRSTDGEVAALFLYHWLKTLFESTMLYNLVCAGVGVAVDAELLHMLWELREEKSGEKNGQIYKIIMKRGTTKWANSTRRSATTQPKVDKMTWNFACKDLLSFILMFVKSKVICYPAFIEALYQFWPPELQRGLTSSVEQYFVICRESFLKTSYTQKV